MGNYIRSMITLSCFCSFVIPFLKHGSKLKKYVAFSVSVVALCSVLVPLYGIMSKIGGLKATDFHIQDELQQTKSIDVREWTMRMTDVQLRSSIKNTVKERFGIDVPTEKINISYDTSDYSSVRIITVKIDMSENIIVKDLRELEDYISDMMQCDCEVLI